MDHHGCARNQQEYANSTTFCVSQAKPLHAYMLITSMQHSLILATKLVNLSALRGSFRKAHMAFQRTPKLNVHDCNAMIREYVKHGLCHEAIQLYHRMQDQGVAPNKFTFSFVIKACMEISDLKQGIEVHEAVVRSGFESNVFVGNYLLDMYGKFGYIEKALQVFDKMLRRNVVSWTTMITGYVQWQLMDEALMLFRQMQMEDVEPNSVTLTTILPACGHLASLRQGEEVHCYLVKKGFEGDVFVGSALLDMYAKCGKVEGARQVFDKMPQRNVVSWNGMIGAYAQNGHANEAIELFAQIQGEGIKVNSIAIISVLPACARLASLRRGKEIHDCIVRYGFDFDVFAVNALIDMYAKCGTVMLARHVFDRMSRRDVGSWTTMIAGYGMHGHGEEALNVYNQMQHSEISPNEITFAAILSACSHAGLVDEGEQLFDMLKQEYPRMLTGKHYACMVDLLGRAGLLDEAWDFIKDMPLEPGANVWGTLLAACRMHGNVQLGELVADKFLELEPDNEGFWVLLANMYADAGRWEDVARVRKTMKVRGLKKIPAYSWIEIGNRVYIFHAEDKSHPQCNVLNID